MTAFRSFFYRYLIVASANLYTLLRSDMAYLLTVPVYDIPAYNTGVAHLRTVKELPTCL